MITKTTHQNSLSYLNNHDVIEEKISDHRPMIHDNVLFWNIMMQGRKRQTQGKPNSYNNGFGITETIHEYQHRLVKIANVIAEMIKRNPTIQIVTLCEGPILKDDIHVLSSALKKHASMQKFFANTTQFHSPNITTHPNWGLLMLTHQHYQISEVNFEFGDNNRFFNKLANRIQIWKIIQEGKPMYIGLGHFPFGDNEYIKEQNNLSILGHAYRDFIKTLLQQFEKEKFIFCADFNFNPYLISDFKDRHLDKIQNNNSILLTQQNQAITSVNSVTVDGILLSTKAKQIYFSSQSHLGLFSRLSKEHRFTLTHARDEKNKSWDAKSQARHDQRYGLIPHQQQ